MSFAFARGEGMRGDGIRRRGCRKMGEAVSGRHQLLNPRHFLREFKAELLGFIIGQPID